MKIYVASSWRNKYQPDTVEILRKFNHEVYDFRNPPNGSGGFAWSDIDENWQAWTTEEYCKALQHPVAEEGFNSDFDGMKWADVCVMVLPCGRSANTEAGWMKGAGKKVYVFQPEKQEPELMYKIYDGVFSDINLLVAELATLSPSTEVENGWVKDAYGLFSGNFISKVDRILRDKGASNKDVFDAMEDVFHEMTAEYKISKK